MLHCSRRDKAGEGWFSSDPCASVESDAEIRESPRPRHNRHVRGETALITHALIQTLELKCISSCKKIQIEIGVVLFNQGFDLETLGLAQFNT